MVDQKHHFRRALGLFTKKQIYELAKMTGFRGDIARYDKDDLIQAAMALYPEGLPLGPCLYGCVATVGEPGGRQGPDHMTKAEFGAALEGRHHAINEAEQPETEKEQPEMPTNVPDVEECQLCYTGKIHTKDECAREKGRGPDRSATDWGPEDMMPDADDATDDDFRVRTQGSLPPIPPDAIVGTNPHTIIVDDPHAGDEREPCDSCGGSGAEASGRGPCPHCEGGWVRIDDSATPERVAAVMAAQADQVKKPRKAKGKGKADPLDAARAAFAALGLGGADPEQIKEIVQEEIEAADRPERVVVVNKKKEVKAKFDTAPHEAFDRILALASQGVNVMMVGPAGSGKTTLGHNVAEALGRRFAHLSCSAGISESHLAGWLLPVEAGGQFVYVPAPFVELYETGGVFLLDEIDAADPNLLVFLNTALANSSFAIPQRRDNPVAHRHADFTLLAAANTYGNGADAEYVGRNQLDAATLDRFRVGMCHIGYDRRLEASLIDPEVLTWGLKIRGRIGELKLRRIMSTRTMIGFTKMKAAAEWGQDEWETAFFADWSDDERRRVEV